MPWSMWIFIVLVVTLSAVLVIDEYRWRNKFCRCCLRYKAECNCGPACHWCCTRAGKPPVDLQPFRDALARDDAEYRESPEYKRTQDEP